MDFTGVSVVCSQHSFPEFSCGPGQHHAHQEHESVTAHWYIEIYNDFQVDTALRWKCHFDNIPSAWNISFDDQDHYYPTIQDGDSADFAFPVTGTFPQKLIIGAALNDTPGTGSVHVDIFDPDAPSDTITITYHFIITAAPLGLSDLSANDLRLTATGIVFSDTYLGSELEIFDMTGKQLAQGVVDANEIPFTAETNKLYRIVVYPKESREAISFSVMIMP